MCKCVEQFIAKMEHDGAEPGSVEFPNLNILTGELLHRFTYRAGGKKRTIKSYLVGEFCSVCGKRYDRPSRSRSQKEEGK